MNTKSLSPRPAQFGLKALFEFVTICCMLAAFSSYVGIVSSICLMGFALCLSLHRGEAALLMLGAASLGACLWPTKTTGLVEQLLTIIAAAVLCAWYKLRSRLSHSRFERFAVDNNC
jgi:hypothetical protein